MFLEPDNYEFVTVLGCKPMPKIDRDTDESSHECSSVRLKFEQFQLIVGDGVFVDRVAALNRLL